MNKRGPQAAADLLSHLERSQGLRACLYEQNGTPIAGNNCAPVNGMPNAAPMSPGPPRSSGVYRDWLHVRDASGKTYFLATELPYGPVQVHHTAISFALHWFVMLLVSSTVCYLLTLRLTKPILRLREASRQISEGNLEARVTPTVEARGDEFGDLARDFNTMAARIENLLSSQRQLISDVSHELRSPLTRIQLAMDLLRKRGGDDPAFASMQSDLERLEELIARLLTVARVEAGGAVANWERLDLSDLVAEIAADAQLEAREKNCTVVFEPTGEFPLLGDEHLLRSALENVVRNAVAYTNDGTEVLITLTRGDGPAKGRMLLQVSDHGPGVPESELQNIFRPFYRVGGARDRQSGGTGLGLAIASRVVQLHHGTITASNLPTGGLRITMTFPASASVPA
jgi:two-component system sensor histidine kinase CpxA